MLQFGLHNNGHTIDSDFTLIMRDYRNSAVNVVECCMLIQNSEKDVSSFCPQ